MEQSETDSGKKLKLETQNFSSPDELYDSIKKEGSLGLLALGATGLKLWREKRLEEESKINDESK